nr:MAG TPA: hypothetical protein [Caudoviricetes sp.]
MWVQTYATTIASTYSATIRNGAYTIRTCTTFLLDRLATYSDTITAMHHIYRL